MSEGISFRKCCKCLTPMTNDDGLYPRCLKCRASGRDTYNSQNTRVTSVTQVPMGSNSIDNKRQEMMRARISLQAQYEKDKEVYAEKMREKERKKLLEKLSRYKGVGELGHNMQDNRMAYEKKAIDMLNARDLQQAKYEAEKAEHLARKAEKEEKIRERERIKMMEELSKLDLGNRLQDEQISKEENGLKMATSREKFQRDLTALSDLKTKAESIQIEEDNPQAVIEAKTDSRDDANSGAYQLGGRQIYKKGNGDHPLLARLTKRSSTTEN